MRLVLIHRASPRSKTKTAPELCSAKRKCFMPSQKVKPELLGVSFGSAWFVLCAEHLFKKWIWQSITLLWEAQFAIENNIGLILQPCSEALKVQGNVFFLMYHEMAHTIIFCPIPNPPYHWTVSDFLPTMRVKSSGLAPIWLCQQGSLVLLNYSVSLQKISH